MKVAVISSYAWIIRANNYGALLQYYALQQYLRKRGHHVYWIRCLSGGRELRYSTITYFKSLLKGELFYYKNAISCHEAFMNFVGRFLSLSESQYENNEDLSQNPPMADIYITGSDQVWGGVLKENYLRFVNDNSKKVSYAASFGTSSKPESQLRIIKPWLQVFRAISVREASGLDICKSMGIEAKLLIDPTLLLDRSEYPTMKLDLPDYIFCYFLNVKDLESIRWKELKDFAKSKNCELKICAVQGSEKFFPKEYLVNLSPEEWLGYYKYAKFVVTNSFHGTAFSIIFQKKFGVILQQGNSKAQNTRMENILAMFDLKKRFIAPTDNIEKIMNGDIDWNDVELKIQEQRLRSDTYFRSLKL